MHIAYFTSRYPYPSDTYVRNEISALRAIGHEISTFALRKPPANWLIDANLSREAANTAYLLSRPISILTSFVWAVLTRPFLLCTAFAIIWRTHTTGLKNRLKQVAYLVESARLARLLQSSGTRHLHTHISENSATVAMAAAHLIHIPFSMTVHGPGEFFHPRQWGLAEKIKRSAFTVCISNFCRSQCMVFATPPIFTRLHVIHCGLGPDFLAQAAAPPITSNTFLCVGRLCAEKGFLTLLDAAAQLRTTSLPFNILIVGDGPMKSPIEKKIIELNLSDSVQLKGWQSSCAIRELLLSARCLVLPSFSEGLPMVLMEALALARPVIATGIAGIPELIDATNGWLIPPASPEALASAMAQVLKTPTTQLDAMGRIGRTKVLRNHNAAAQAEKLAALFQKTSQQL